jgi:hypothetical protein
VCGHLPGAFAVFISSRLICSTSTCAIERKASSMPELAGATVHGRGGYECFPLTLLFAHSLTSLSLLAHLSAASFASISSTCQKAPPPIRQQQVTMRDVSKKQAANPRAKRMAAPKAPLSLSPRRKLTSASRKLTASKDQVSPMVLSHFSSGGIHKWSILPSTATLCSHKNPASSFTRTDVPEDRLREKDTVAHNPYYKHIDIGYWSLVEEVFLKPKVTKTYRITPPALSRQTSSKSFAQYPLPYCVASAALDFKRVKSRTKSFSHGSQTTSANPPNALVSTCSN